MDSTQVIGNVKEKYPLVGRKGWDWPSFYNGWIEGRFELLRELGLL